MFIERIHNGDNLFEYVIALALVGVVAGLALYNIQQSDILLRFIESSVGGTVKGGSLEFGVETTGGIANNLNGPANLPVMTAPPNPDIKIPIYDPGSGMASAPPPSSGLYAIGESDGILAF